MMKLFSFPIRLVQSIRKPRQTAPVSLPPESSDSPAWSSLRQKLADLSSQFETVIREGQERCHRYDLVITAGSQSSREVWQEPDADVSWKKIESLRRSFQETRLVLDIFEKEDISSRSRDKQELDKVRAVLMDLETEIQTLRVRLAGRLQSMRVSRQAERQSLRDTEQKLETAVNRHEELTARHEHVVEENKTLTRDLAEASQAKDRHEANAQSWKLQTEDLMERLRTLMERQKESEAESLLWRQKKDEAERSFESLRLESERVRENLGRKDRAVRKQARFWKHESLALRERMALLENCRREIEQRLLTREREIEEVRSRSFEMAADMNSRLELNRKETKEWREKAERRGREFEALQAEVQRMQKESETLRSQKTELDQMLETRRAEYLALSGAYEKLKNGFQTLQNRTTELLRENRNWKDRAGELKTRLVVVETMRQEAGRRADENEKSRQELEEKLQQQECEAGRLRKQREEILYKAKNKLKRVKQEARGWKQQFANSRAEEERSRRAAFEIEARLAENTHLLLVTRLRLALQCRANALLKTEQANLQEQIQHVHEAQESERLQASLKIETLERRLTDCQVSLSQAEAEREKQEKEITSLETAQNRHREEYEFLQLEIAGLKQQLAGSRGREEQLESEIRRYAGQEEEMARLKLMLHGFQEEKQHTLNVQKALEQQLEAARRHAEEWQQESRERHALVQAFEREKREWEARLQSNQLELERMRQEQAQRETSWRQEAESRERLLKEDNDRIRKELEYARTLFVRRLEACAEEIDYWKQQKNSSLNAAPSMADKSFVEESPTPAAPAPERPKAEDKQRPAMPPPSGDPLHSLRYFQEVIEKGGLFRKDS